MKIFKLVSGEIIATEVQSVSDSDEHYLLIYPAIVVPTQQKGQLGFGKFLPFSDYGERISLNKIGIMSESEPVDDIRNAYDSWVNNVKSQESGIVVTNKMPGNMSKAANRPPIDINELNTGG